MKWLRSLEINAFTALDETLLQILATFAALALSD